jgi:DNA polymerase-1
MIKLAMIHIYDEMLHRNLKSKMLLQVHDELVFDVHKTEQEELRALVEDKMKNALPDLSVPVEVGMGVGENWLEAH